VTAFTHIFFEYRTRNKELGMLNGMCAVEF
jgi:hypothetical protein